VGLATRIDGNELSGNDVGISLWSASLCCNVTANTRSNNFWFGYLVKDESTSRHGGAVSGGQVGVGVWPKKTNSRVTVNGVSIARDYGSADADLPHRRSSAIVR
jgi:hypothetical protein